MSFAVVSDIHGNFTALEAVATDIAERGITDVVHGGDLVLAGCQPAAVLDRLRELGWPGILGNTDELLWRPDLQDVQRRRMPKLAQFLSALFQTYAPATMALIGEERLSWLRGLPLEHRRGSSFLLLHASPGDLWRAPLPKADDRELIRVYGECQVATVAYGHVHRPFIRRLETLTVANSGAVGSPLDGDPRASYLLFDGADVQVVRVEYDLEREISLLKRSGYPHAAQIAEMRRTGRFVPVG